MLLCPFDLSLEPIAAFLNCELADHPVYDGLELQRFDDPVHGRGLLAFLSRRADRKVDFYVEAGLSLDPESFAVGAGIGRWGEARFDIARLCLAPDGVDAEVRFRDHDGRLVEVRVDDRDGRRRRRARLLAPVSSGIERPHSLLLVYMTGFDLVRASGLEPRIRIDGVPVSTGRLPAQRVHRRLLIKSASGLAVVHLGRAHAGPAPLVDPDAPGPVRLDGRRITGLHVEVAGCDADLALDPPLPDLAELPDGASSRGAWTVHVAGDRITGGRWSVRREGHDVHLLLDVTRRWRPRRLPLLMRVVTRVVPTFRRWPTTYRWTARLHLGDPPTMVSGWERTATDDDAYRRATGTAT